MDFPHVTIPSPESDFMDHDIFQIPLMSNDSDSETSSTKQLQEYSTKLSQQNLNICVWCTVVSRVEAGQLDQAQSCVGNWIQMVERHIMHKTPDHDIYEDVYDKIGRIMSSRRPKVSKLVTYLKKHIENLKKETDTLKLESLTLAKRLFMDKWNSTYSITSDLADVALTDQYDSKKQESYLSGELDFICTHCNDSVIQLWINTPLPESSYQDVKDFHQVIVTRYSTQDFETSISDWIRQCASIDTHDLIATGLKLMNSNTQVMHASSMHGMRSGKNGPVSKPPATQFLLVRVGDNGNAVLYVPADLASRIQDHFRGQRATQGN